MYSSSPGIRRYVVELQRRLALPALLPPKGSCSGLRAHLWEQSCLARVANGRLLFSPGNTGPLWYSYQVATIHDLAPLEHPEFFTPAFGAWYRVLIAGLARTCMRIVVPSAFTERRLLYQFPSAAGKTVVIYHGADHVLKVASPSTHDRRRGDDPAERGPCIVTVGTLEPRKNLRTVLDAWRFLRRRGRRDARLFVIGGAAPRRVFVRQELPSESERIVFVGTVNDAHLVRLYRRAVAAVYVPFYEGFGLPILEAMACGTPVVASDIPVVREIAGDAVLRIDPRSPMEIAIALARLLDDATLRDRLSAAGCARAQRFLWNDAAQRTARVLLEVA